jgi:hypothetical protein
MGALLLIGKNPFKGFSLTALVTTKPLAAKLSPYGKSTSWQYGLGTQKGGTTIKGGWREKQTGKPIGLIPKTIESVRTAQRYRDIKGNKAISHYYVNLIKSTPTRYINLNITPLFTYCNLKIDLNRFHALESERKWPGLTKKEMAEYQKLKQRIDEWKKDLQNASIKYGIDSYKNKSIDNVVDNLYKIVKFSKDTGIKDLSKQFLIGATYEAISSGNDPKEFLNQQLIPKFNQKYVENDKTLSINIDVDNTIKMAKSIQSQSAKQDLVEMIDKNPETNLKELVRKYATDLQGKDLKEKVDAFSKVESLTYLTGMDLTTPFLEEIAKQTKQNEKPEEIINKIVSEYDSQFINRMRYGSAPRVIDDIKKETNTETVFDLPSVRVNEKDISKASTSSTQVSTQLTPQDFENLLKVIASDHIEKVKSSQDKILRFSYLNLFGLPDYIKQQIK